LGGLGGLGAWGLGSFPREHHSERRVRAGKLQGSGIAGATLARRPRREDGDRRVGHFLQSSTAALDAELPNSGRFRSAPGRHRMVNTGVEKERNTHTRTALKKLRTTQTSRRSVWQELATTAGSARWQARCMPRAYGTRPPQTPGVHTCRSARLIGVPVHQSISGYRAIRFTEPASTRCRLGSGEHCRRLWA
jgi:hypothetical protein